MTEGRRIYSVEVYCDQDGRRVEAHVPANWDATAEFIGEAVRIVQIPGQNETPRRFEFKIVADDVAGAFDAFDATAAEAGAEVERHVARQALDSCVGWTHAQRRALEAMAGTVARDREPHTRKDATNAQP